MEQLTALVERTLADDAEAFAEIVRRFQDMAVGYSYSLLHDRQLAEDASQEAFLESYLCLRQLREPEAFPGWFRRILFKQCDRFTRAGRLTTVPLENGTGVSSDELSQADTFEQNEIKNQVWTAIDALPESERTPVVLFYLSGYSQREVGEFLDLPVTSVKKRLFSARQRLREMLFDIVVDTLREGRPSRDETFLVRVLEMLTAARTGNLVQVKELLTQNKRLLNARDWLGNSALIMAVNSGQQAIAELLFNAGVRPDIHEAAAIGDTERVQTLLAENSQSLNSYSAEGFTPAALAAHFGHRETLQFLIEQGADLNAVARHPLQVTALHAALFGRQIETARLLVERGANLNAARGGSGWPRAGWTALHYAAGFGFVELIELLLTRGADMNALDEKGKTPRAIATEEQQHEAAALLRNKDGEK